MTETTHDHPEGMKGPAPSPKRSGSPCNGEGAEVPRREITRRYGYDLEREVDDIRPSHRFDVTCQGRVPPGLICTLESTSLEDSARIAVSLGGDADTLAAIAGAVGQVLHVHRCHRLYGGGRVQHRQRPQSGNDEDA